MKNSITLAATFSVLFLSPAIAQPSSNSQNPDPHVYHRFTPSMAIIIGVLISALFLMGFFSIYIRQCQAHGGSGVGTGNGVAVRSRRGARGLDAAVIETFPTMEYSEVKGLKISNQALECAVCICEFEDDETLRQIPKCDHVFHPECIDKWLESHTTCPVCRANLVPDPAEQADKANPESTDVEAQTGTTEPEDTEREPEPVEPDVWDVGKTLNRNRTRGGSRSDSTEHSLFQPGENTERFTLRLPVEVRKEIVNRQLQRTSSMVVLPREGSSRGGRYGRRLDRTTKSDRWVSSMAPLFFSRISSIRLPKVAANNGSEGSSVRIVEPNVLRSDSDRQPV